jgi:hypothetical protein
VSASAITVKPQRKSRKAPGLKADVITRRVQGQSKRSISKDLGITRGTVATILEESHIEQHLETYQAQSVELVPEALRVMKVRLSMNSENAAIKTLESTIWPLNAKQNSKAADPGLVLAIGQLMGNVSVTTTNSALLADQPKSTTLDVVPLPAKTE